MDEISEYTDIDPICYGQRLNAFKAAFKLANKGQVGLKGTWASRR